MDGREFWSGSYKQYDLEPALLASTGNSSAPEYHFPEDATIANADEYRVYYKPENGKCGTKDYVEPGKYIKKRIDGVSTSKHSNMVFKVPDYGRVYVKRGGDVQLTMDHWPRAALRWKMDWYQFRGKKYEYGWMPFSKLDDDWRTLFDSALKIK